MKLKFFAKDDQLVNVPHALHVTGQAAAYVGRSLVIGTAAAPASFPASAEPFEVDSTSPPGAALLAHVKKELERHNDLCLWPADEATAKEVGVPFRRVSIKDGVAVVDSAAPVRAASAKEAS